MCNVGSHINTNKSEQVKNLNNNLDVYETYLSVNKYN